MTHEVWLNAMNNLDIEELDDALCIRAKLLSRIGRKIKPLTVKRLSSLAACLAVLLTVGLYVKTALSGSQSPAPHTVHFTSLEAAKDALSEGLLLDRMNDPSLSLSRDILVTYPTYEDGTHGDSPLMLKARFKATESDNSLDTVDPVTYIDFYILFDKSSVDDSYIGGYEEQGLSKQYGDITIVYSLIEDGMMHGQAKFLYEGNLYVIDVNSTGEHHFLMKYLDMLFGRECVKNPDAIRG